MFITAVISDEQFMMTAFLIFLWGHRCSFLSISTSISGIVILKLYLAYLLSEVFFFFRHVSCFALRKVWFGGFGVQQFGTGWNISAMKSCIDTDDPRMMNLLAFGGFDNNISITTQCFFHKNHSSQDELWYLWWLLHFFFIQCHPQVEISICSKFGFGLNTFKVNGIFTSYQLYPACWPVSMLTLTFKAPLCL